MSTGHRSLTVAAQKPGSNENRFRDRDEKFAAEPAEFEQRRRESREKLERLEAQLGEGPFFNGPQFALVDAAIAPAFMRLALLEEIRPLGLLDRLPKVQRWSAALLGRDSVRNSVVPEFPGLFREYLFAGGSYLARGAAGR